MNEFGQPGEDGSLLMPLYELAATDPLPFTRRRPRRTKLHELRTQYTPHAEAQSPE